MSAGVSATPGKFRRFRLRLVAAMMLVVATLTATGLFLAQRRAAEDAEREVHRDFRSALNAIEAARETRAAALKQRCLTLVRKARIHAALEDDALDLLYPNARDELADLMGTAPTAVPSAQAGLHAKFYRFLDLRGAVIAAENSSDIGRLTAGETARLALPRAPAEPQLGYLHREGSGEDDLDQVITTPILSTTTRAPIAALAVGFDADVDVLSVGDNGIRRGIWSDGRLRLPGLDRNARARLVARLAELAPTAADREINFAIDLAGAPHLALGQQINPGSSYPTAYEICLYPLAPSLEKQRRLRWQIIGLGTALLLAGLAASQVAATGLSRPVEKLAADSAKNIVQLDRAEAALEATQAELERAARFASDASHQLKTPVAVFRASLDELLARDDLTPTVRDELNALVSRTYRFTGMIEDLLLLSRMEAGQLQIDFSPVNLTHLIDSWLDDLSVLPDARPIEITTDLPGELRVLGEPRYVSIILQNLLENARKYNRPQGRIHIAARADTTVARLTIGNTGSPIPVATQPHIFNRFYRGTTGENIPGHGLGLNLARLLAQLHGGDVQLNRSANDWTEFEIRFRLAIPEPISVASPT